MSLEGVISKGLDATPQYGGFWQGTFTVKNISTHPIQVAPSYVTITVPGGRVFTSTGGHAAAWFALIRDLFPEQNTPLTSQTLKPGAQISGELVIDIPSHVALVVKYDPTPGRGMSTEWRQTAADNNPRVTMTKITLYPKTKP